MQSRRELGNPPPEIAWFQDQIRIGPDPNLDFTGSRLKIKSATAVNSGTYSCEATNSAGSMRSTEDITLDIVGEFGLLSNSNPPQYDKNKN